MTENTSFKQLFNLAIGDEVKSIGNNPNFKTSYLPWATAAQILFEHDPQATYEFVNAEDGFPLFSRGDMHLVKTRVTMFGVTREMTLPIMDNRHNAIAKPSSRDVSDALMRCLAKNVAMFGIGLRLYKGDDYNQISLTDVHKSTVAKLVKEMNLEPAEVTNMIVSRFHKQKLNDLFAEEADDLIKELRLLRQPQKEQAPVEPQVKPQDVKPQTKPVVEEAVEEVIEAKPATPKKKATPKKEAKVEAKVETPTETASTGTKLKQQTAVNLKAGINNSGLSKAELQAFITNLFPDRTIDSKFLSRLTNEEALFVIEELENLGQEV